MNNLFGYQFTSNVFTTMDGNDDGQITKAEFASQWMEFTSRQSFAGSLATSG